LPPFEAEDFTVESIGDFRSVVFWVGRTGDQRNRRQSFTLADVKSVTIEKSWRDRIALGIDLSFHVF
jgi:hypothetical protein